MSANGISTHVLDTSHGMPAGGLWVVLEVMNSQGWLELDRAPTDTDGRISPLRQGPVVQGEYRLRFLTEAYFTSIGQPVFYPEVVIHVRLAAAPGYHLPLLLSPYGYSTYRGS